MAVAETSIFLLCSLQNVALSLWSRIAAEISAIRSDYVSGSRNEEKKDIYLSFKVHTVLHWPELDDVPTPQLQVRQENSLLYWL